MIRPAPLGFALAGCVLLCGPALPQGTQLDGAQAPGAQAPCTQPQGATPQGAQPENEDSRFTFFHVDGGYLRLDGGSGRGSMCAPPEAGGLCPALPEERAPPGARNARLRGDNAPRHKVALAAAPP